MQFLLYPELTGALFIVKIVFIVISVVLAGGILLLYSKASWAKYKYYENYTEFFAYRPFGVRKEFKKWIGVIKKLETGKEAECKMAVIEADDLLKEVLQKMNYKGDFLDDVLAQIDKKVLPSIDQVLKAHEMRNDIVHNPGRNLTPDQARNIIRVYQKALSELEMF